MPWFVYHLGHGERPGFYRQEELYPSREEAEAGARSDYRLDPDGSMQELYFIEADDKRSAFISFTRALIRSGRIQRPSPRP